MITKNKSGYVLIMSLLMLSVLTIIVSRLFYKAASYTAFSKTIIESQKAKQLALSGISLAISRMSIPPVETDKNSSEDEVEKALEEKFLMRIFPILNLWQEYKFTEEKDSFDGVINYVVACENGKLNLNKIYLVNQYFLKKKGGSEQAKALEGLAKFTSGLKKFLPEDYILGLQEAFNERKYPYNDVSELLKIKQFDYFNTKLFLDFPLQDDNGKNKIFLTDLFTIFTNTTPMQPLLLSHSVIQMLGLEVSSDPAERKNALDIALSSEPPPENTKKEDELKAEWNNLFKPLYKVEFEALPENASAFLDPGLMPTFFSVVSSARVGSVTKKLYAILQMRIIGDNEISFEVVKLYWIN